MQTGKEGSDLISANIPEFTLSLVWDLFEFSQSALDSCRNMFYSPSPSPAPEQEKMLIKQMQSLHRLKMYITAYA